jgi:hypothetical protein
MHTKSIKQRHTAILDKIQREVEISKKVLGIRERNKKVKIKSRDEIKNKIAEEIRNFK